MNAAEGQGQVEFTEKDIESEYGFQVGQIVETPAGRASVLGVNNGELYFIVEGRGAPSYWSGYTAADFQKEGFTAETPVVANIPPKGSFGSRVMTKISELGVNIPLIAKSAVTGKSDSSEVFLPIEIDEREEKIIVLDTSIERGHGGELTPSPEKFRHFVLDERTLSVIGTIAEAVKSNDSCLLIGETGTSKTSSIEYLGMVSENEVVRINLNGQTDTSELIGKFVPNDGEDEVKYERLVANPEQMKPASRAIFEKAKAEVRQLNEGESKQIAEIEGLTIADWCWVDGAVPTAMAKGQWLILDEVNLAEPQILERLNSVLERNPSLVLSEHQGEQIGPGGEQQVDPKFRIFATMNPAEYQGRNPLSPAYRDRWATHLIVENPTETQYQDMMKLLVFGEHPLVESNSEEYRGIQVESYYPKLSEVPNISEILLLLAKFQIELERMAKSKEIGKSQKEPYIFTRRGLIEILEYMGDCEIIDRKTRTTRTVEDSPKEVILRAIQKYYLNKMRNSDDERKVGDLLDAVGLSEDSWHVDFGGGEAMDITDTNVEFFDDYDPERYRYETTMSGPRLGVEIDTGKTDAGKKYVSRKELEKVLTDLENQGHQMIQIRKCLTENTGYIYVGPNYSASDEMVFADPNGDVVVIDQELVDKLFKPYSGLSEKAKPQTYESRTGSKIESDGRTSLDGLSIGDNVFPLIGDLAPVVYQANRLVIVGFTEKNQVIVQMDGGAVFCDDITSHKKYFTTDIRDRW